MLTHTYTILQVVYTLWVRFMQVLSNNRELSAQWAKPVALPFFQDDADYPKRFQGFSLAYKQKIEKTIEENGNSCDSSSPIIRYDRCSEDFISLWKESGRSMEAHVRKRGPTVVPGRAALIWPGLSLSHFVRNAVPAWSLHERNTTQVFGKWVFDTGIQCKAASIDTAVCADVSNSPAEVKMEAVIPWLGGDYNPW